MPLTVITDAVGFVREHPAMFFPDARPSPIRCVSYLVDEVFALGATDVAVERRGEWWIVSSSFDWFLPDSSPEEQVRRLIPLPEAGQNASRVEVVILAFSEAVATRGGDLTWRVLAGPELPAFVEQVSSMKAGRVMAFRFAEP